MTTFTLQDLNLPATAEQAVESITKEEFMEYGMTNPISASAIEYTHGGTLGAPEPQPSGENPHKPSQVNPEAVIEDMVAKFSISLRLLLATVINQPKAQPEGAQESQSLQQCVALTLQQAEWFKEMVGACIDEDMVRDAVKDAVESEVDTYFRNEFDPTYHFDFGDAVSSEVSDQLDDVVRDRLDEVVQEQLEEVVAERLKNIRVVFD